MRLVEESLYDFERGMDPKTSLGIGRVAKIRKWAKDLDIPDDYYEITPTEIIVKRYFDLSDTGVTWLPDGLTIKDTLYLNGTEVTQLPNGLKIGYNLWLTDTPIKELPKDLQVHHKICVNYDQKELIAFIESSNFADKLRIS